MAITPKAGYMVDPNNPNGVIRISDRPATVTGGMLPTSSVSNQGKAGYDVFGNPVAGMKTTAGTDISVAETPEEMALREARASQTAYNQTQANQPIDEAQIRAQALAQMQAEIDAQNSVFADKLARAKVEGQGRLGQSGAIQARRGLLGSDFGAAQTNVVSAGNEEVYGSIENQKQAVIQSLLNKGAEMGAKAIAEKRAAKEAGLSNYIASLSGSVESAKGRAKELATAILNSGSAFEQLDPASVQSIAEKAGVTVDQIKNAYADLKKAGEAEAAKTERESVKSQADIDLINQKIAEGKRDANKPIEVGGYIYKPDGQGNWVNSGEKVSTKSEGLTPFQQFSATQSIAKDTQARTESAREMARQANLIDSSYSNILNGGDRSLNTQAIITAFNKILDPSSVVRESEYDRTAAGQSLIARLEGKIQNISAGGAGVTPETLKEAADIAKQYLAGAKASIELQNKRAQDMAKQFGLNPDFVGSVGVPEAVTSSVVPKITTAPDGTQVEIID